MKLTPIEKISLPLKSRDALPPLLAGLQWIWRQPTLKADIFALLEAKILAGGQKGHGLNRCLDVGIKGYERYVGYGVLSYNLHVIGRELLARERAQGESLALAA